MDVSRHEVGPLYWPLLVAGHHPHRGSAPARGWRPATHCRRTVEQPVRVEMGRVLRRLPWGFSVVLGRSHDLRLARRFSPEAGRAHSAGSDVARGGSAENAGVDPGRGRIGDRQMGRSDRPLVMDLVGDRLAGSSTDQRPYLLMSTTTFGR